MVNNCTCNMEQNPPTDQTGMFDVLEIFEAHRDRINFIEDDAPYAPRRITKGRMRRENIDTFT
ncbi:hypothetical protein B5M10_12390 [Pluralibacter gergoviae]|nr:hypothetical protein B5M10_12390 [Pluralibacter gergoviae]